MSRSNQTNTPTYHEDFEEKERYYVGYHQPEVETSVQKPDPYEYERWKASRRLGIPEWELPDEPDYNNRLDNIDEGN